MKPSLSRNSLPTLISCPSEMLAQTFGLLLLIFGTITAAQAQSRDAVLAKVNNQPILQAEVDAVVISQLLPLQQQIYALRKSALDNLVSRALLDQEAQKRGITVDELRKQLTAGSIDVTGTQVEALYQETAPAFAAMSPDEAKERLRLDLESQGRMRNYRAALAALKSAARIELQLEEPRLPASTTAAADDRFARGPVTAPVTIIEFSDFQCPYCRDVQKVVKQILLDYPNDVRMSFKNLPLDIHDRAFNLAQAAFCAGEQGAFWQYHDALFSIDDFSPAAIDNLALKLGMKPEPFKVCLASEASRAAVASDLQEARRLGINSTPTFVINGKLVRGSVGLAEVKALIDHELRSQRAAATSASSSQPISQE